MAGLCQLSCKGRESIPCGGGETGLVSSSVFSASSVFSSASLSWVFSRFSELSLSCSSSILLSSSGLVVVSSGLL